LSAEWVSDVFGGGTRELWGIKGFGKSKGIEGDYLRKSALNQGVLEPLVGDGA